MLLCKLFALKPVSLNNFMQDGANGSQQVWAIDPAVLQRSGSIKESRKGSKLFRPVYILQPEAVSIRDGGGRGYRKYDRGRSFSPPKRHHRKIQRDSAAGPSQESARRSEPIVGSRQQVADTRHQSADAGPTHQVAGPSHQASGSAPQYASYTNLASRFRYNEGVRKSFSSDQLFVNEKPIQENSFFSLSSRSSNTSTGSSVRSGAWQKDMRSGIPIPIPPDKLRLRTCNNNNNGNSVVGPVIARRSVLGSPVASPVITRISPRHKNSVDSRDLNLSIPPASSGSESSGYFTPPSDTKQAFVKLDTEDNPSESEESTSGNNDKNNNSEDCVDSCKAPVEFVVENSLQRNASISSAETSDAIEEVSDTKIDNLSLRSIESEREELRLNGFSTLIINDAPLVDNAPVLNENCTKSKSVVDLHNNFLPEINSSRKSTSSAPLLKENIVTNEDLVITGLSELPHTAPKTQNVEEVRLPLEIEESSEVTITRKLSRRLSRQQSKRSIKSTPRSINESTPKSVRSAKPKETLQQALAQINNPEWEVVVQGLQNLTKIARYHPDIVEAQMHTVCVSLAKHIKNLRSQVARIACNTASELFTSCRRGLDMEVEELAGPLLQRTADTNKFLRADANSSLDKMCEHLPLPRVIAVIITRGCLHQNGIVRSASMRLLKELSMKLGAERIFHLPKDIRDKLLLAGANSLTDGSLEARSHGKCLFSCLSSHYLFRKALHEAVPQNILRHIAKTLSTLKPSHSGT